MLRLGAAGEGHALGKHVLVRGQVPVLREQGLVRDERADPHLPCALQRVPVPPGRGPLAAQLLLVSILLRGLGRSNRLLVCYVCWMSAYWMEISAICMSLSTNALIANTLLIAKGSQARFPMWKAQNLKKKQNCAPCSLECTICSR